MGVTATETPDEGEGAPRSIQALGEPPPSLEGFPRLTDHPSVLYREHSNRPSSPDRGCGYYSTVKPDQSPAGRFDLPAPDGTCYLATSHQAAILERCGRFTSQRAPIPTGHLAGRIVSTVTFSPAGPAANTTDDAAPLFGITREIGTVADYQLTSRWAQALHTHGFTAIVYWPRFSTGTDRAYALFDKAGPNPFPAISATRTTSEVARAAGLPVATRPSSHDARYDDELPPPQ
jgi:RES domain